MTIEGAISLARLIYEEQSCVALTGAGVSTENEQPERSTRVGTTLGEAYL